MDVNTKYIFVIYQILFIVYMTHGVVRAEVAEKRSEYAKEKMSDLEISNHTTLSKCRKQEELRDMPGAGEIPKYISYSAAVPGITGLIANIMIITVFLKNEEMRTAPNIFVLSLAVVDILIITNHVFNEIIFREGNRLVKSVIYGFAVHMEPYTLVAMNIDRLISILKSIKFSAMASTSTRKRNAVIYLIISWSLAALIVTVETIIFVSREVSEEHVILVYSLYFTTAFVLPSTAIACVIIYTAKLLRQSVKNYPGEIQTDHMEVRMKSTRILIALSINYVMTFLFFNVSTVILNTRQICPFFLPDIATVALYIFFGLRTFFLLTAVNSQPIILYVCSPKWKKCFQSLIRKKI